MANESMLEKVDILRKRFNLSYKAAYDLLEQNDNNVVKACIAAEDGRGNMGGMGGMMPDLLDKVEERITVMGHELLAKVQEIVRTGQASKIRVIRDGQTVLTIPAAAGAAVAILFPTLTVLATVAAMTQRYELVWDKRRPQPQKTVQITVQTSDTDNPHQPGLVNVHDEEKEPVVLITPSISSGKQASAEPTVQP